VCTLSWTLGEEGFAVAMNRDERPSRLRAAPPLLQRGPAGDFLAPVDGNAGGTWIAVNEHGLALALLNAPLEVLERPPETYTSRGQLVRALAGATDASVVAAALGTGNLAPFRGFTLAVFSPGSAPRAWTWNGASLEAVASLAMPLLSSPLADPRIEAARRSAFGEREPSAVRDLLALHGSHEPERGSRSVCMHAEEAGTVSLTLVEVRQDEVRMRYADGPPCEAGLGPALALPRRPR
jgi:hypothetical protein